MNLQNEAGLHEILKKLSCGEITCNEAFFAIKAEQIPDKNEYEDLGFAKVDHGRAHRNGFPEVIFCEGKTIDQIISITKSMLNRNSNVLGTRADLNVYEAIIKIDESARYNAAARVITIQKNNIKMYGHVAVVSAGTADIPVSEEAAETARALGLHVSTYYDVGVAGLKRLLSCIDQINQADVIIVVAGMEGALSSVVGGLTDKPVLAVPSGIGYGANFEGLATLLAMLNCCASGVAVLNIGNGFGAGYMAATICRQIQAGIKSNEVLHEKNIIS